MADSTKPPRLVNPKSEAGTARSAAALRANLAKRKAQVRARKDDGQAAEPQKEEKPGDKTTS